MFCGREKETQQIIDYCKAGCPVVVSCHPGLGATALLQDGVAPALRELGFIVVAFREWQGKSFRTQLMDLIATAVREQADDTFLAQRETLTKTLARVHAATERPLALLCDQFEDYLRCHAGSALSDEFDAELSEAISSREGEIVIALHDYAVKTFQRLEQYVANPLRCHVKLGPLDESGATQLIAGAGFAGGVEFEPEVVDALLEAPSAKYKDGYHPFYLMAGVERVLDAGVRKKWNKVSLPMIEVYGTADRLILESLDMKMGRLNATQVDLFFRWCALLISPAEERLAVSAEALADYSGRLNRFALTLLPVLVDEAVLRTVELSGTTRYEIARDSLIPLVRDWWKRREATLIARRRAQFRTRSLSLAGGLIVALYIVYLILSLKQK